MSTKDFDLAGAVEQAARTLAGRQQEWLERGVVALVAAGVPVEDIEVVHETYSKGDDFETIHQRAYVRTRKGRA